MESLKYYIVGYWSDANKEYMFATKSYDSTELLRAKRYASFTRAHALAKELSKGQFVVAPMYVGPAKKRNWQVLGVFGDGSIKPIKEDIKIDVNKGDTVLVGRFKNKPIKVKKIGKDDHGMPTINGRVATTFRLKKESMKLKDLLMKETPDRVTTPSGRRLSWNVGGQPFGVFKNKFYVGDTNDTHWNLGNIVPEKEKKGKDIDRYDFIYAGRVWPKQKIISFWDYPKTNSSLLGIIKQIGNELHANILTDETYMLELSNGNLVLISKYFKKNQKIQQRSKEERGQKHVMSPLVKGHQDVPPGVGSRKTVAGMPYSVYHNKQMTSDGVVKLMDIINEAPHVALGNKSVDLRIEKYPIPDHEKQMLLKQFISDEGITGISQKWGRMLRFKKTGVDFIKDPKVYDKPSHIQLPSWWEKFAIWR
jgi:co-chaperonin GroES (HSP10)